MRHRTVLAIAKLTEASFSYVSYPGSGVRPVHYERVDWFREFLFEVEFESVIVGRARLLPPAEGAIKEFVIRLWESSADVRVSRMERFAAAVLAYSERPREEVHIAIPSGVRTTAIRELELDGYRWSSGRLVRHEENVFDVADQEGALVELYRALALSDLDQVKHDLKLADDQYAAGNWGDSVKHARDVSRKPSSTWQSSGCKTRAG